MNKRALGWLVAIIVVVGIIYTVAKRPAGPVALAGEVTIGAVFPLTGDAAAYGEPLQRSVQLAADEINRTGGVGGKALKVLFQDGKCAGPDATNAIQQLVNVDRVQFVIGGACSGETLAMAPIVNEKKVVLISPSATSPDITTKGGDYVFRTAPSDAFQGRVAAEYAYAKLEKRKAAVISESTDYAQGLSRVFIRRFGELGGAVATDEKFNPGETNFQAIVTKALRANPDVIYLVPQAPAAGLNIMKQLRNQGATAQLLAGEVLAGRDTVKDNAEAMEGLIATETAVDESVPATRAFLDVYRAKHGEPPFPGYQSGAYDITFLARDAFAGGATTGEAIQAWLAGLGDRSGALGTYRFDGNGDAVFATYAILKAENGAFTKLSTEKIGG
ncbi:ABC transporter substrate-binding protein [Candidatus Uhrbacteria bacterium]|nr:ABC transporter substrate-binding protein [Candidatus Uhrbacteria bacterium]